MEMKDTGQGPMYHKGGMTHRRARHKRGGEVKVQEYNAQGSNEAREADEEKPEFKHGGHADGHAAKHRPDRTPRGKAAKGGKVHHHGGHHEDHEHKVDHDGDGVHHHGAHGHAIHHHGEGDVHVHKRKGGAVHKRAAGGRTGASPYSSARHLMPETGGGAADGHEGQKVPAEQD